MIAETIDYGPYVGVLQQFGPPDLAPYPDAPGTGATTHEARLFWELIEAISFQLVTSADVGSRFGRVQLFADDAKPFAVFATQVGVTASKTTHMTFAVGVNQSGLTDGAVIVAPLAPLMLQKSWTAKIDIAGGFVADAVSAVRIFRRRFRVVELERT